MLYGLMWVASPVIRFVYSSEERAVAVAIRGDAEQAGISVSTRPKHRRMANSPLLPMVVHVEWSGPYLVFVKGWRGAQKAMLYTKAGSYELSPNESRDRGDEAAMLLYRGSPVEIKEGDELHVWFSEDESERAFVWPCGPVPVEISGETRAVPAGQYVWYFRKETVRSRG
ncbi:MAG: hypothetical protein KY476_05510 [Planctomycetes bacterium]|nr:hypothetical protein [Planctomycetota bacterium]